MRETAERRSNILHATSEPTLLTRLGEMLRDSARADIAVGYFFVSGFHEVADQLTHAGMRRVRLLVGRTDRRTLEEIAAGLQQAEALAASLERDRYLRRGERDSATTAAVDQVADGVARLPQTAESEAAVRTLRDFIASGRIEIRSYARGRLHAKAYLCWYADHAEPGAAVVGSSNFTLAGFTGNTELNVRVTGDAEMSELRRWFDALWEDSQDITEDIAARLEQSWVLAATPPYHVYLKALYELYGNALDTPLLAPQAASGPELANFQLDAVRHGLRMIERHGGCFIGDVVGLGKTYVGAELLRQLRFTERFPPLIICPAGLVPMWERMSELFGLGAAVVSMSAIAPPPGQAFDYEEWAYVDAPSSAPGLVLQDKYPNRGAVLVDEAHNFRNPATRRYRALEGYLRDGDRKVVLVSATPQNLGPKDIYYQLRLFLDDVYHGLDIDPSHLEECFGAIKRWYEYRTAIANWRQDQKAWEVAGSKGPTPERPREPDCPHATIESVLAPVFLRRRRREIREQYGENIEVGGRRARFPTATLENLPYRLDRVYAKAGKLGDLLGLLTRHTAARYRAFEYVKPEKRREPQYRDLLRARGRIAALIRYLVLKRLESSVAALRQTLDNLMESNRAFKACLQAGFVPIGATATRLLAGEAVDPEEVQERLKLEEERREDRGEADPKLRHPTADFEMENWQRDLDADYHVLTQVRAKVEPITPADDDKLHELKRFLALPAVAGGKVLIFSEAEATVEYLFEQLCQGEGGAAVAKISGSSRASLQSIIRRFAPKANPEEGERLPGSPIRVLIATDMVSEGQNLQDCNRILNYDLHWNPVRLIQRFGRVDRIGTTHETIHLHNTWPDVEVDAQLDLTKRLGRRIQAFHDFIGLDAPLLSQSERINEQALYSIYATGDLPEDAGLLDELSAQQRGLALLERIRDEDPQLWELVSNLPDGIRSAFTNSALAGQQASSDRPDDADSASVAFDPPAAGETVVLLEAGNRHAAYAIGGGLKPRPVSPAQMVAVIECDPKEPAQPLSEDTNERVTAAHTAARKELAERQGREGAPPDTRLGRYVSRQLRLVRDEFRSDERMLQRISGLQDIFTTALPARAREEAGEVLRMRLTGVPLIQRLEALRGRHGLSDERGPDTSDRALPTVRLVCSDGLVVSSV